MSWAALGWFTSMWIPMKETACASSAGDLDLFVAIFSVEEGK